MCGCESWTIKKAECRRTDSFQLWCWGRLLRVPWTDCKIKPVNSKRNQPWIFIGRTDDEAEAPIVWPLDVKSWKSPPCWEKTEGKRRRGQQRIRWLDSITNSMDMNLSTLWETVEDRGGWQGAVIRVTESDTTYWLSNNNSIHYIKENNPCRKGNECS